MSFVLCSRLCLAFIPNVTRVQDFIVARFCHTRCFVYLSDGNRQFKRRTTLSLAVLVEVTLAEPEISGQRFFMEQFLEMQEAGIEASIVYSPTPNYPGANPVSHGPPMVRIERASPIQSAPSSPALPFDHSLLTPFDYEQKDFAQRPSSAPPATVSFDFQAPAEASSFCQNSAFSELLPPPPPLCESSPAPYIAT